MPSHPSTNQSHLSSLICAGLACVYLNSTSEGDSGPLFVDEIRSGRTITWIHPSISDYRSLFCAEMHGLPRDGFFILVSSAVSCLSRGLIDRGSSIDIHRVNLSSIHLSKASSSSLTLLEHLDTPRITLSLSRNLRRTAWLFVRVLHNDTPNTTCIG